MATPRIPDKALSEGEVVADTTPLVAWRKPVREVAKVVTPLTVRALDSVVVAETANVPVAVRFAPVRFPAKYPLPATSSLFEGEEVPMPKYPLPSNSTRVVVAVPFEVVEAMTKIGEVPAAPFDD